MIPFNPEDVTWTAALSTDWEKYDDVDISFVDQPIFQNNSVGILLGSMVKSTTTKMTTILSITWYLWSR